MKYVQLQKIGNWDTRSVLKQVMNISPRGLLLDEMRRRIKIMDLLDEMVRTEVPLDEDQFRLVSEALTTFHFNVASKDLLAVIDAVLSAPSESVSPSTPV